MKTRTITLLTLGGIIFLLVTMALAPPANADLTDQWIGSWDFNNNIDDSRNSWSPGYSETAGSNFQYVTPGLGGTAVAGRFIESGYDRRDGYVRIGPNNVATSAFTVAYWIDPKIPLGGTYYRDFNAGQNIILAQTIGYTSQALDFWIDNGSRLTTPYILSVNTPSYVVLTWEAGGAQKIYIDGTQVASRISDVSYAITPGEGVIGGRSYNLTLNESANAILDKVNFWNRALTSTEVGDLFANAGNPAGNDVPEIPLGAALPFLGILGTAMIFLKKKFFGVK